MLKVIGLSLIITGAFGTALWNVRFQKQRLKINEAMLDIILYIRNRIMFFHEDLNDIYQSYENDVLQKCGFLCELSEGDFIYALNKSRIKDSFDDRTGAALWEFGKKLGKSGIDEQISNCDYCIEVLEKRIACLQEEIPKKSKTYSSLCIIAGLAAVLLLI